MVILVVFGFSVVLSVGAVALVLKLSHRKEWYDHINERKIHSGEIPRLGGIGFASVFIIITAGISFVYGDIGINIHFLPCLAAMVIILASGAYDDFHPVAPRYKLMVQFFVALTLVIPGFIFRQVLYLETGFFVGLGWLSYPITLLWIIGLINAMNLIDGVDGLAGGLSAIIAFFFGLIFFSFSGISKSVLLCTCLFGVLTGFLIFNAPFPKAKIFMGDCGSQFLGFSLALMPLMKEKQSPAALPVLYAAALLAIPIFDTIAAVWRRIRDGNKIYEPDTAHIHHKLINLGFSAKGILAILYSLQIVLGVLTFISVRLDGLHSLYVLGAAYFIVMAFFATIHFLNRKVSARKTETDTEKTLA